ncbi:MAG: ribonuclease III domain-containing protein [Bryobacteraceae bacterium]|nr:ribonuclease III domain-containing protein [Bryobacteraceae bacterium]
MDRDAQLRADAWIGDAVLLLYARRRILNQQGAIDAPQCTRLTSNQFLSAFGDPTAVEAGIGRLYKEKGLDAAFAFIEATIIPLFEKREARQKPPRGR